MSSFIEKKLQAAQAAGNASKENKLFDALIKELCLKNDAALSRALEVAPPIVSKVRHGKLSVGDSLLIRIHEVTGWAIRDLKQHLEMPSVASCASVAR